MALYWQAGRNHSLAFRVLRRKTVNAQKKIIDGWKIRSLLDWWFATASFMVFVTLESAMIYSYFVFLHIVH